MSSLVRFSPFARGLTRLSQVRGARFLADDAGAVKPAEVKPLSSSTASSSSAATAPPPLSSADGAAHGAQTPKSSKKKMLLGALAVGTVAAGAAAYTYGPEMAKLQHAF